jgi:hypothetical protein
LEEYLLDARNLKVIAKKPRRQKLLKQVNWRRVISNVYVLSFD